MKSMSKIKRGLVGEKESPPRFKGYIQVYTGDGKGKTTAALGLALRAAGAGLKVYIAQFVKSRRCSEHRALERFKDLITLQQFGTGFIEGKKPTKSQIEVANKGLEEVKKIIISRMYDVVILDEANIATHCKLFSIDRLVEVFDLKPPSVELILTGKYADERVIQRADLVTEMKEIKHYFKNGVKARRGIES